LNKECALVTAKRFEKPALHATLSPINPTRFGPHAAVRVVLALLLTLIIASRLPRQRRSRLMVSLYASI
jgi:hypothetical protein